MKVGKFQNKGLGVTIPAGANLTASPVPYGLRDPNKKIWFGPINKRTAGGNSQNFNTRGPTWDFTWVEYCEVHSRPHTGTTIGQAMGTICCFYNHNPTLWLPATLNSAINTRCFLFIVGRTGGRR